MPRFLSHVWVIILGLILIVSAAPGFRRDHISKRKNHVIKLTNTDGTIMLFTAMVDYGSLYEGDSVQLPSEDLRYQDPNTGKIYGTIGILDIKYDVWQDASNIRVLSFPIDANAIEVGYGPGDSAQNKLRCIRNPANHQLFAEHAPRYERCLPHETSPISPKPGSNPESATPGQSKENSKLPESEGTPEETEGTEFGSTTDTTEHNEESSTTDTPDESKTEKKPDDQSEESDPYR